MDAASELDAGITRRGLLIVLSSPSGAGKSSFLKELRTGRMAPDIHRALPPGVETWPLVHCNRPEQWQPQAAGNRRLLHMVGIFSPRHGLVS